MRKNRVLEVSINSIDDLALMSDDELLTLQQSLNLNLDKATKKMFETKNIEEELAYVQREWQIRSDRKLAHAKWVDNIRREIYDEEKNLPVFVHSEPYFNNAYERLN